MWKFWEECFFFSPIGPSNSPKLSPGLPVSFCISTSLTLHPLWPSFCKLGLRGIIAQAQTPTPEPVYAHGTASYGLANLSVDTVSRSSVPPGIGHKCWTPSASSQWANRVGSDTRSRCRSTPPLPPALHWHCSSVCDSTPNTALPLGLREPAGWPANTATALFVCWTVLQVWDSIPQERGVSCLDGCQLWLSLCELLGNLERFHLCAFPRVTHAVVDQPIYPSQCQRHKQRFLPHSHLHQLPCVPQRHSFPLMVCLAHQSKCTLSSRPHGQVEQSQAWNPTLEGMSGLGWNVRAGTPV